MRETEIWKIKPCRYRGHQLSKIARIKATKNRVAIQTFWIDLNEVSIFFYEDTGAWWIDISSEHFGNALFEPIGPFADADQAFVYLELVKYRG